MYALSSYSTASPADPRLHAPLLGKRSMLDQQQFDQQFVDQQDELDSRSIIKKPKKKRKKKTEKKKPTPAKKCPHGRVRNGYYCKLCPGKGICEHGLQKNHCKECMGVGSQSFLAIDKKCPHGRARYVLNALSDSLLS